MYNLVKKIHLDFSKYKENQQGAVTVEFVVLTGIVVLIGVAASAAFSDKITVAITSLGDNITAAITGLSL